MDTTSPMEMLVQFAPLLLPIVILIIIGLSVWLTLTLIRRFGKSDKKKNKLRINPSTTGGGGSNIQSTSRSAATTPLLAVRQTPTGEWAISVNGIQYYKLEAVPDEQVRQQVVQGIRALATFARDYVKKQQGKPTKPAAARPSSTTQQPQAPTSAPSYSAPRQTQPQQAESITRPPAATPSRPSEPATQKTSPPVSSRAVSMPKEPKLKRQEAPSLFMPTIDLAKDIGAIVEEMQIHNPALINRSIKLHNAPGGGIYFAIDGITYADLDHIPDAEIQALIRAATKEWERR